jgi:SAM-dependent methyltransferase
MAGEAAPFDAVSQQFLGHYQTIRGHVREQVVRHNLVGHLGGSRLDVLDYQGGSGRDTIWFASDEMRDNVFLLDDSPAMIERAVADIQAEPASVRRRIQVFQGGLDQLPSGQQFDVILSHGVLMYELDDPQAQIDLLASRLRQRGILSLLTKGYDAASRMIAHDEAAVFKQAGRYTNRLGLPARAYNFEELDHMLRAADLKPSEHYGVRLLSDDDQRRVNEVPSGQVGIILDREKAASRDPELMEQAQMLHVVAVK